LIKTMNLFRSLDIPLVVEFCRNESLVSRARNNMVARAMNDPEMTHIMFIDNDISWNPVDLLKLLFSEKDVVGGIYPLKRYHWSQLIPQSKKEPFPVQKWLEKREQSILKDNLTDEQYIQHHLLKYNVNYLAETNQVHNSLCEVRHVATGFMMIRRQVFEKMAEAFPSTKYEDDVGFLLPEENTHAYALFDCGVENGHYYSEDWMFCHRWSNMGGEIFMDISIPLTHTGIEDYKGFILSTLV